MPNSKEYEGELHRLLKYNEEIYRTSVEALRCVAKQTSSEADARNTVLGDNETQMMKSCHLRARLDQLDDLPGDANNWDKFGQVRACAQAQNGILGSSEKCLLDLSPNPNCTPNCSKFSPEVLDLGPLLYDMHPIQFKVTSHVTDPDPGRHVLHIPRPDQFRYYQTLPDITRHCQILPLPDITRYYQILPDVTRYYQILPDITRYYQILLDPLPKPMT